MKSETKMTILGHLAELRSRLLKSVIAVIITSSLSFVFADKIFQILVLPAKGTEFIFVDMTEMLSNYIKVCLTAGIMIAMPFLAFQLLMFAAPALTPKEKGSIFVALPVIVFMFIAGAAFSYFVLLPPALNFLTTFGSEIATPQIRISSYLSIVTRLILATGIMFELPVISTFLARLGIITPEWLARKRKFAFVLSFILAAIITPTADPVNQSLVAAPLIVLYEMSIGLAKLVGKKHAGSVVAMPAPQAS